MKDISVASDLATIRDWERQLGATVIFNVPVDNPGGPYGPRANTASREIHAISLDDQPESFWSTMHELGHIAHKHDGKSPLKFFFGIADPTEPEKEAEAWTWAIDHANRPLDIYGQTDVKFALASYLYGNEPREAGDPDLVIGPNLRRLFVQLGPSFNTDVARKLFQGAGRREHVGDAARVWERYATMYGDIKSAA